MDGSLLWYPLLLALNAMLFLQRWQLATVALATVARILAWPRRRSVLPETPALLPPISTILRNNALASHPRLPPIHVRLPAQVPPGPK